MSSVYDSVFSTISALPDSVQDSPTAQLALALAESMDSEASAAVSKEISRLLAVLADSAPVSKTDPLDDLAAARAARRGA